MKLTWTLTEPCFRALYLIHLMQVVALALANLEPAALSKANMAACNNACWSLGALRTPARCRSSSSADS